jgi:triacylglycerol lipase
MFEQSAVYWEAIEYSKGVIFMLNPAKTFSKFLSAACLVSLINIANADVLVLVHGYMGSPASWEESRINGLLERNGWQRGGIIVPDTRKYFPDAINKLSSDRAKNISYVIDMPWMRPLEEQADYLEIAMQRVFKMRPDENITLVGHSAGALVARLWLVQYYEPSVIRLISIAAPNLGTPRAIDALELTDPIIGPLDAVRSIFGGKLYNTVRHSRDLVYDFTPPSRSNPNVLYWLNRQPHPDIEYISVVREDRRGYDKDWLITANSQDLNNVPALRGKSRSYIVSQDHPLNREDGHLLASILAEKSL